MEPRQHRVVRTTLSTTWNQENIVWYVLLYVPHGTKTTSCDTFYSKYHMEPSQHRVVRTTLSTTWNQENIVWYVLL
ncbi:hypothetical protein DPMN_044231 [Dreissena polymorpha]|uniref:Uncharacterized protein n=1 Tax=Dreissena polymorpha TaxID=45954 RepID=A0A9D4D210_DREPO|nr:hypothetical protein DPMN_044231 [Dreissena polymorpha]